MRVSMDALPARVSCLGLIVVVAGMALPMRPARAQDEELRQELRRAQERLAQQIATIIERREARLRKRIGELEEALAKKDRQIAALEKRLGGQAKPPVAAKPARQTNAFLGVGHVDNKDGAYVTAVQPGSPAANAGVKTSDIIVTVNGKKVSSETLGGVITSHEPGTTVKLALLREGKREAIEVKLVDREKFFAARVEAPRKREAAKPVFLGIWVEELSAGVVVDEVDEGYTGQVAGLKEGDRITHVNGKAVKTNDQLAEALKKINSGVQFTLTTVRENEVVEVSIIGSAGKEGAKLVSRGSKKAAQPGSTRTARRRPRRPAFLGVAVEETGGAVVVDGVLPNTSAAKAGIRAGDILKKVNGNDLKGIDQLREILSDLRAGQKIRLGIQRGERTRELEFALGARPARGRETATTKKPEPKKEQPAEKKQPSKERKKGVLGITAQEFGEDSVVVKEVRPGGPADKAGLKPGDVILKVNDRSIANFEDLAAALEGRFADDEIQLRVKRDDEEKDLKLTLGEPELELDD